MPTRPATWRREKVGSFSTWAIRLARKVSPKDSSSLMVWCGYYMEEMSRQGSGIGDAVFARGKLSFVVRGGTAWSQCGGA